MSLNKLDVDDDDDDRWSPPPSAAARVSMIARRSTAVKFNIVAITGASRRRSLIDSVTI
jgi:hypothetical protein